MISPGVFLYLNGKDRSAVARDLEFIKKLDGIKHIEVWWEDGRLTDDDARWLRKELGELDCLMHAPYINMAFVSTFADQNESSLSILKRALDQAKILQAKVFTFHIGDRASFIGDEEARGFCLPYVQQLVGYAGANIKVAVENVPFKKAGSLGYPNLGEEVERLMAAMPDLYTTVDIGHSVKNKDDYASFINNNRDRVADIHLHNVSSEGKEHFGFNHHGVIEIAAAVGVLHASKYHGYLTLEILTPEDIEQSWKILNKALTK